MSLDYNYIFSQIDKAKKKKQKKGYIPWNSPESKKLQESHSTREAGKKKISQHRYKDPKDRKPGEKPSTYTKYGQGTGRMQSGAGGESITRRTDRGRGKDKPEVKGPDGKVVEPESKTRDTHRGRGNENRKKLEEEKEHNKLRQRDENIRSHMEQKQRKRRKRKKNQEIKKKNMILKKMKLN